jgi:hypothetical protein
LDGRVITVAVERWRCAWRQRGRRQQLGQEVTDDEGVDIDKLWARADLLEVVAGLEVHG